MYSSKTIKTILNKKRKRDAWFLDDYTLNLYSGCSFNCLFCYIRGSKYGEHMDRTLQYKSNALELLEKQLFNRAKKDQYGIIVMSSSTDPYLQAEKDLQLTRDALGIILKYKFPVHIITRSNLILRDVDLIHQINQNAILPYDLKSKLPGVVISFSFSTLDDAIAKIFEPGATPPSIRLETFKEIKQQNFFSGISLMPLLPYITDTGENLENYFKVFSQAKANYLMPATITLFGNGNSDTKTLVFRAIKKHFPELIPKYEKLFSKNDYLPSYYNKAFSEKVRDLALKYKLNNRIIGGIIK